MKESFLSTLALQTKELQQKNAAFYLIISVLLSDMDDNGNLVAGIQRNLSI
jgi:hypothetical protein